MRRGVVEDVSTSGRYTSGWKIPQGTPGSFAIANERQTEEEKCPPSSSPPAGLCPVTFPFHSCSPNLLLACSPSRLALPYPNFLALDIHPILSYPLSSQPILILVSLARSLDQSFDQRRAPSRFPIVPAFPNRPDVCPSFNPQSCLRLHLWRVSVLPPSSSSSSSFPLDTASVTNQNHTVAPLRTVEKPVRLASDWIDKTHTTRMALRHTSFLYLPSTAMACVLSARRRRRRWVPGGRGV